MPEGYLKRPFWRREIIVYYLCNFMMVINLWLYKFKVVIIMSVTYFKRPFDQDSLAKTKKIVIYLLFR